MKDSSQTKFCVESSSRNIQKTSFLDANNVLAVKLVLIISFLITMEIHIHLYEMVRCGKNQFLDLSI